MSATVGGTTALGDNAARQLANATKTVPQLSTISPRWLTYLLQWSPVEAGIYRLNRVKNPEAIKVTCTAKQEDNQLPRTYVDYEEQPREYFLNAVSTILDVHTRISDLYSSPHDQIKEQLRLTIEIDGQAQLFLDLVMRAAVEVGDARVHIQDGGDGVEEVLARLLLVVHIGARQLVVFLLGRAGDLDGLRVLDAVEAVDARLHRRPLQQVRQPARADGRKLGNGFG